MADPSPQQVPATNQAPPAPQGAGAQGAKGPSTAVYVGDLAPDVTETVLYEIFNAVAPVNNIRVCRNNITRASLGYAYVNFQSAADAQKAIEVLSYTPIRGRPCRIMWSQRDPTLRRSNLGNIFVKNLAPEITSRELFDTFKVFGTILSCKVALDGKGVSKGYGFVHFDSEAAAKGALEDVNGMEFGGRVVEVMHYVPRTNRASTDKWTNLYVKNIPKNWSKKQLDEAFAPHGEIISSVINLDEQGVSRGFGFVSYRNHESALKAIETLNGVDCDSLPNAPPKDKAAGAGASGDNAAAADGENGAAANRPVKFYVGRAQKKAERERLNREKAESAKRERAQKWSGCNLYIRNLDESITDEDLRREFGAHGSIVSAKVSRDADGRSRLFGFVCYSAAEEASKARELMNRRMLQGKPLFVTLWESKDARAARLAQTTARGFPNARGPAGMGVGQGAGGPAGAMNQANMAMNGMNLMLMQPQMLANLVAGFSANPQLARMMQNMTPETLNQALQSYMASMSSMMRMMPGQGAGGAAAAQGAQGGARGPMGAPQGRAMAGFPSGFNPAASFAGMVDPAMAAAAGMGMGMPARGGPQGGNAAARRGAPGQQQGPVAGATAAGPGGARVAVGPQGKAAGGPTAAAVVGGAAASQRGPAPGQQGAAGGAQRGAVAGQQAGQSAAQGRSDAATAGVPGAVSALAPAAPSSSRQGFLQQLASATPKQRKNLIGEQLYGMIAERERSLAGKITGMLLDGMDDTELLHLLESPSELDGRIREALDVLEAHKAGSS
jgi:polyadenylate-binding protein